MTAPRRYFLTFTDADYSVVYAELIEATPAGALDHALAVLPPAAVYCQIEDPETEGPEAIRELLAEVARDG